MKVIRVVIYLSCLFLSSCDTVSVYEKITSFPAFKWDNANKPSFVFTVKDTTSLYNIYVVVRHEDAYHFNNLWLNITTKAPGSEPVNQQLELILANNAKGWRGSGLDDIFTHRVLITQAPIKLKKGDYQFTLQQTMRENPLESVLDAGIRVEKATP